MSEFKATPGPWFISGNMTLYIEARISGGLLQEVAAVGPTEADGGYGEQQRANARLIAAAPELLDACQAFLEYHDAEGDDAMEMMLAYAAAVDLARDAIAKALGEQ